MSDICENATEIELETLEAIYVNELTYSRNADGQLENIELLVHPATGHDVTKQYVCMTLVFTISSEYPNELPEIVIKNPRGLGEEEIISLVEDMILKAEEMKGDAMLYTLIEMAKDSITEGNIPHCPCVVCLEHFHQRDVFHRTACYHYFHNRCLYKYLLHAQTQLEVEEKEASERRHLDAGGSDKDKTGKIICPVCRSPLDEESLMVTCSLEELEEDEKAEEFVMPPDLKEQQRKMSEMYEHQKAKGGIIDLEHEKNKYLVNPEDRMPVRGQRPPVTIKDDVTKTATNKHGSRENSTDRPNSRSRQYGSSQQYGKGRGRGRGNFYSSRPYHEWSDYEDRPGFRPKAEDGAGRRASHHPGSGSRRMKDVVETDLRTEEVSGQRKTSEERRQSENTKRIWEKERRMKDNDTGMRKGHTESSFNEVRRMDGGFTRTDMRERLEERYDHQRRDERQKVDRRQDNTERYERRDDDKFNDHDIASRDSKQMEAGRMTETDIEFKKVENERGSFSARSYRTGAGHNGEEVSEGRKTYAGGSYQTHQKYYSNRKEKDSVYNNDDEPNEAEKDISRKELPKRHTETNLANNEVEPAKSMYESENESRTRRSDRFDDVQETSGEGRRSHMYEASTARASSAVRDGSNVPEYDMQAASEVDRPIKEERNASFKDQDDDHAGYDRRGDWRLKQGYDYGSSGYQRGGGSYRSRGAGSGPKQRGGKFHEGRSSYAGYSDRSNARNDRPQQQQHQQQHRQQQWHQYNRHGEERERVDRNVQAASEQNAEDELNSTTTGKGACGTDITSESGSKDDEEADMYYQPVRPQRQKSPCIYSGNTSEVNTTRRLISVAHQDLLDHEITEDEAKAFYGISGFYFDKHSHKNSGSEIIGYDNAENDDNDTIKAHKTYRVYSEAELKTCYVGFDEVDQDNWDEEMDIYHYERYKIRPQRLKEYNKEAVPRKKYFENKIQEKQEQQNMIREEEIRILKEKSLRVFMDNEMESPVKTESKKDVRMKSILDTFKEEKAKELGISVTMSESNGRQSEIIAMLSETAVSFESKVDRLYKSTKQNIGSGYISQGSGRCELLANHEIPHTSNRLDITSRLEEKENNNHMYSKGLNRKKTLNTKSEDTKIETFNTIGQGQYSKVSVSDKEDFDITTTSSLDGTGFVSHVVCPSKYSLGKVAESKGVCYTGVSRRSDYRESSVCLRGDHTDIGAGGVSHRGDCMDVGDSHIDSHRDGSVSSRISHRYGVSYRANHDPCWGEHRDKGVPVTSDIRDIGVSHIIGHRHGGDLCMGGHGSGGVSSRDIHRDSGVFCRDEHRDKGVPLTSDNKDSGVGHRDENPTYSGIGGPAHKIEHTSMPASFIKNFKKAPPLKFPKKNRQRANSDSSSQIPVVQPAALSAAARGGGASLLGGNACNQSRQQASEENSKHTVNNYVVTNGKVILSETTSATLNARPPASLTDLSTALLNSYMVNSVLSGNLLSSNQSGLGLNPSLLSLYGTYPGNFSNGYLSGIYPPRYSSVQNVGLGNSAAVNMYGVGGVAPVNCLNTYGVGDVAPVNCVINDGGKTLEASGMAGGKENINISPFVTK